MKVAIDAVGRMVVPKPLRDELGLRGATVLEIVAVDGHLEVAVPDLAVELDTGSGFPRFLAHGEAVAPLDTETVRDTIERTRR